MWYDHSSMPRAMWEDHRKLASGNALLELSLNQIGAEFGLTRKFCIVKEPSFLASAISPARSIQSLDYVQTAQNAPRVIHIGLAVLGVLSPHVEHRSCLFA
jgi:hypothetical protein